VNAMQKKLELIANALDVDKDLIVPEKVLEELEEWDSMGVISIISMLDKNYKVQLKADQIKDLKTVSDILEHMQER